MKLKRFFRDRGFKPVLWLDKLNGLLRFSHWLKNNRCPLFLRDRLELYSYVNDQILKNQSITYVEFGVFEGDSIKDWSSINTNDESHFYGFDSFTGLAEDWKHASGVTKKGTFDTKGKMPEINDDRVSFVKGYFQDSLVPFLQGHSFSNRLVIHMDSDLYTSTLYALTVMDQHIVSGTVIVFDEFFSVDHEFRAFIDYTTSFLKKYRVVAATPDYIHVAIEILSSKAL